MTSDRIPPENLNDTQHGETTNRLHQLEKDFRFNILLLSERDSVIENYQATIQKLCYLIIENGLATRDQMEFILQNMMVKQQDIIPVNKSTQCSLIKQCDDMCEDNVTTFRTSLPPNSINEDISSKLQQFLQISQSYLMATLERDNSHQNKEQEYNIMAMELQSTNSKISQLKDINTNLSNHVSSCKSEYQGLSLDNKQLVEQVSALQDEFSVQRSLFHSFYRSKERAFLDAKEKFVDIESKLINEIETLQLEITNLKSQSTQCVYSYDEEHRNLLYKNCKLTKLLFVLKEFILNERNVFLHQIASKDNQTEKLSADIQMLKATQAIKSDEIITLQKELTEYQKKHKILVQENRQVELDLLHSYEEREQVLTAAHQARLENICIEHQQLVANLKESNDEIIQLEESLMSLKIEKDKCLELIIPDINSVDITTDYLPNKISELLGHNVNLREVIEEMKSTIESLNSSKKATHNTTETSNTLSLEYGELPLRKLNFIPDLMNITDRNVEINKFETLQSQLDQKTNELKQLDGTIEDLKSVLSQKDSLINSFNQHFSLLKSFSQPTSLSKLSIISKDTTQEEFNPKMKIFAQRYISLMREKYRLVETNHKLKLVNADLKEKYMELASKSTNPESQQQTVDPTELQEVYTFTQNNIPNKLSEEIQFENTNEILSSPVVPINLSSSPNPQNSTLLSFNISNQCPDWFNDTNFQQALFYADNPELIDHDYSISNSKVITGSNPIS
ncbi:hypothetical protein LOD99_534 [Oopsacas minuta]|uniref:Uncharacterized protein n=1 Tax=Oopsacas minuta TaxID=111878 RepID=A0AAV7KBV9_9METZ|nr:hypothetical protein LOD99_534 [Oopsacas minuta]